MTPKSVRLNPRSRAKRLALLKERYHALILRRRQEIELDLEDSFDEDEYPEPPYD